ncbi:MAG: TetR/AcrR family transcriptional regulator [Treponema sp.]|jgi:AcrR family transcriptional regulator|nr:TetR/AcrR family transcriptional regulator [Treponema sp.]
MTKTEIVDAAFKVWGRNFYRKTSLSQLAVELKVSKPALYRHFKNKQALTEAMTERFLDDFAASIRADFERAQQMQDADEGIFTIVRSISGFFARNVYALLFSLINIYDRNLDEHAIYQSLKARDVDMRTLSSIIEKKYDVEHPVVHMIYATLYFFMAFFHKAEKSHEKPPCEEKIQNMLSVTCKIIEQGIGYSSKKIDAIDFEKQETMVGASVDAEIEPLFKAVAEAVAEVGPWDASMDMVAKRLGLSKSSLYGHFKNRKDMLRRLFTGEFKRIIEFARQGIGLSNISEEQLYLGIFAITVYFRSHPEFLISLDWIRTRKLDLGKPERKTDIFRLFEDVDIEPLRGGSEDEKLRSSHWILFLLINILTKQGRAVSAVDVQNNDIRVLYRFITLGLGGFKR